MKYNPLRAMMAHLGLVPSFLVIVPPESEITEQMAADGEIRYQISALVPTGKAVVMRLCPGTGEPESQCFCERHRPKYKTD